MKNYMKTLLSYTLLPFPGFALLAASPSFSTEVINMEGFANLVSMLDYAVNTRRKRHITGGAFDQCSVTVWWPCNYGDERERRGGRLR